MATLSATSIANAALILLGEARIDSLEGTSKTAKIMKERYEEVRDDLLRKHPWNFATKRASLAADAASPEWGFDNQFTLPADCLRVLELENGGDLAYRIEGRKVVTDIDSPLLLEYTAQIADPLEMDVMFRQVLAAALAFDTAEAIVGDTTKVEQMASILGERLRDARVPDGQEPSPREIESSEFLLARESGGYDRRVPSGPGTPL